MLYRRYNRDFQIKLLTVKFKIQMSTINVILRTSKLNSQGEAPLCIRITKDRISKFIFLNYRIKPELWDDEKRRVKKGHPNSARLNHFITTKLAEAENSALKCETFDKQILTEKIKEDILGKAPESFIKFAEKYILELAANHKLGSHRKTKTVVEKVKEYMQGRELYFDNITVTWLKDYSQYLKADKVNKDGIKKGNRQNTVSNNLRTIRRIFNLGINEDFITEDKNPFKRMKLVTEKVKKEFLTDEELMLIELAKLENNSRLDLTRNMFVFSAYAGGLRISDILLLRWKHFDGERIVMQTKKTASTVTIKLPSKALEILGKFKSDESKPEEFIFPVLRNDVDYTNPKRLFHGIANADTDINEDLRDIVKIAELEKKVTFHTARHTFATRALRKGVRIEYVSKLMGHASISTTSIYAQVVNEELDKAMAVFN